MAAGMKELEIWNRQLLGTISGMAAEKAMPSAVPVCQEVKIWPVPIRAGVEYEEERQYLLIGLERPRPRRRGRWRIWHPFLSPSLTSTSAFQVSRYPAVRKGKQGTVSDARAYLPGVHGKQKELASCA